MQAVLDKKDYDIIAQKLMPIILEKITDDYDLVPKSTIDKWVGLKEFTKALPVIKAQEWVRTFILPMPEMKNWVTGINPGKGRATKVNITKALAWINAHPDKIDWTRPLPRG